MFGGSKIKFDKDFIEKVKKYFDIVGYFFFEEFIIYVLEKEFVFFEDVDSEEEIKKCFQGFGYIF